MYTHTHTLSHTQTHMAPAEETHRALFSGWKYAVPLQFGAVKRKIFALLFTGKSALPLDVGLSA